MATRARIGIKQKSGRIIASYQHWDGYPGGLGYKLEEYWTDKSKVTKAIKLGDASTWGMFIGDKIDFDDRTADTYDYQNVYYGRDRGEKNCGYKIYKDEAEYLAEGFNSGEDYIYLMKDIGDKDYLGKPTGTWFHAKYDDKQFSKNLKIAVKDHIDILTRSCLKEEVA